jgi:hypothetical protein
MPDNLFCRCINERKAQCASTEKDFVKSGFRPQDKIRVQIQEEQLIIIHGSKGQCLKPIRMALSRCTTSRLRWQRFEARFRRHKVSLGRSLELDWQWRSGFVCFCLSEEKEIQGIQFVAGG